MDRLWLQRHIPSPPRKSRKGKSPVKQKGSATPKQAGASVEEQVESNRRKKVSKGAVNKRKREEAFEEPEPAPVSSRVTRRKQNSQESKTNSEPVQVNGSRMRAAKTQANAKLDEQAKQLAAAQAEMKLLSKGRYPKEPKTASPSRLPSTPLGTRVSRRLRGLVQDDEWQQIPDEWLKEDVIKSEPVDGNECLTPADTAKRTRRKAGLDSSEGSELTELSDTETNRISDKGTSKARTTMKDIEDEEQPDLNDALPSVWPPPDFIEWETVSSYYKLSIRHRILTNELPQDMRYT